MKCFGIASPRFASNAAYIILLFFFMLAGTLPLAIYHNLWFACLSPIPFLILFIVRIVKNRYAFTPYWMDENGIHNHKLHIPWQDIANVELINTVVPSTITRGRYIHRFSIGIGEVEYGDLFNQSPEKCIVLPLSKRSITKLQHLAGGKSPALDQFLSSQTAE